MKGFPSLRPEMASNMSKPEAGLRTSHDPLVEMARHEPYEDVPILAWEVALGDKIDPWFDKGAAFDCKEGPGEVDHSPFGTLPNENGDVITQKVKSAVKELVEIEMATMVREALDDDLRKTLHNTQSGVHSVVYSVVELVMLDSLRKRHWSYVRAPVAKHFDTSADVEGL